MIASFAGELNILVFLDNVCTVSVMLKDYYDQNIVLHKCQKIPFFDHMVMHTGNGDIKVHFWTVIPLVTIQLQLLICDIKARIVLGIDAFHQSGC